MAAEFVLNHVTMKFDPMDEKMYPEVRGVFDDYFARTIWLGLRPRFPVGLYFGQQCLDVAKDLRKHGMPPSPEALEKVLNVYLSDVVRNSSKKVAEELFPYLRGEQRITYEVVTKEKKPTSLTEVLDKLLSKNPRNSIRRQEVVDIYNDGREGRVHVVTIYEGTKYAEFQGEFTQTAHTIPELKELVESLENEKYRTNL